MNHKLISPTAALLLCIPFFLIFASCKFDFGNVNLEEDELDDTTIAQNLEDSDSLYTVIGPDSTIAKIWIDTKNDDITHHLVESDFNIQAVYELPEIQNSTAITDAQSLEIFNSQPELFVNVFPELPNDAIGYQLEVEAQNLPANSKLMFRDMKESSQWVWIKNETTSSVVVQNSFAGCDTLQFSPEALGENNGAAIMIPANEVFAFEMFSQALKVNQLQLLLTEASAMGKLLISFAIPGNCNPDVGCYSTYRVYQNCGSFVPKQILPEIAIESMSKRAANDLKKPILKLTALYLLHKKELNHLFEHNAIIQAASTQFLEDHKHALTNMAVSKSFVLKEEQINAAEELLYNIELQTNDTDLQQAIQILRKELMQFENKTLKQALEQANLSIYK